MIFSWISFLLILFAVINGQSVQETCCSKGHEFGINSWQNSKGNLENSSHFCSPKLLKNALNVSNQNYLQLLKCFIHARSCCLKIVKKEVCKLGASDNSNCDSSHKELSLMLNQIKMECCVCCQVTRVNPLIEFDSCLLLEGKCPRKVKLDHPDILKRLPMENDPVPSNFTDNLNNSYDNLTFIFESNENITNSTELVEETLNQTNIISETLSTGKWKSSEYNHSEETPKLRRNSATTQKTIGILSQINTSSLILIDDVYKRNQSSVDFTTLCETGRKWNPQMQACVQVVISCPKNFILNPINKRCVMIIKPKEPCKVGFVYNQFVNNCVDIDECEEIGKCLNKTGKCVNTIGSYKCVCEVGFKYNKDGLCEDIDECTNLDICTNEQKCKNTVGSYKCLRAIPCGFGWKEDLETNDCIDIDECESYPDICGAGMKCVNIRGSHRCEDDVCPLHMKRNNRGICSRCKDGFHFNNVTQVCEDIDECSLKLGWYNGQCQETEVCFNLPGSYECVPKKKCRSGTILTRNGTSCEDIDECKQMKFRCESDQICINTYASFLCVASPCAPSQQYDYTINKCVCREGYQLSGDNICTDIDECTEHNGDSLCGSLYTCINHPGSYSCIHRAECPSGMFRSSMYSSCQDIDECETGEGKCPPNMHCVNMVGSYRCMCNRGYVMTENNTCSDVNECLLFRQEESCPDLEARCVNTAGSYKCQCPKGFQWFDYPIKKCLDINECQNKNPCGKKHECINTVGSYKCKCYKGFQLSASGDSCEDIDECQMETKRCINGYCVNLQGRYTCKCPQGFYLDTKEVCQDIDECTSFTDVCSKDDHLQLPKRCINLFGLFKCVNDTCPHEYVRRETGNGFICDLEKASRCKLKDVNCLLLKPYRKIYEFIEIPYSAEGRQLLSKLNMAHLPPGVSKINLQVKYAHNTFTKESVSVRNIFQLITDRHDRNNVELILLKNLSISAEVFLFLEVKKFHRQHYLGHSQAYIHLYFTKYPQVN